MTNMVPFAQAAVPTFFAGAFAPEDSNIQTVAPLPALSFRGKAWRISLDGQETLITNKEGEPSSSVSVVVLDQIMKRSRVFYEGQYVTGENKPPRCSSTDGVVPDASIAEPIAKSCASCPNSVKGSKITANNKPTTACGVAKRMVVIPASKPEFAALLMRVPQTSLWDKDNKENEAKGWFAWDQYMDFLKGRGVTHTAQVVTKVKFDHRTEYPKLLFTAERWVTPEEWAVVGVRWKTDEVKNLLNGVQTTGGVPVDNDAEDDSAPALAQSATAAAPAAAPAPTRARRAPAAAAAAAPASAPAAAAPAAVVEEEEGDWGGAAAGATQAAQQQAPAQAAAVQAAPATANAGLSSLLGSWDD